MLKSLQTLLEALRGLVGRFLYSNFLLTTSNLSLIYDWRVRSSNFQSDDSTHLSLNRSACLQKFSRHKSLNCFDLEKVKVTTEKIFSQQKVKVDEQYDYKKGQHEVIRDLKRGLGISPKIEKQGRLIKKTIFLSDLPHFSKNRICGYICYACQTEKSFFKIRYKTITDTT